MATTPRIDLSVVIPIRDESGSIPQLLEELEAAIEPLNRPYEILIVDDGSSDESWKVMRAQRTLHPHLIGLKLSRNYGQTAALMAGIDRSRGAIVATMDGDLQNDPADIPRLIERIEAGYDIVTGWRRKRRDRLISRRLPSLFANWIVRRVTRVPIHDQGCALKAYRGEVIRSISLYSDFHRFVVPLTQMGGAQISEVETNHRPRKFGRSNYGIGRTFRVIADITTLVMITRYSNRLLLWFLRFAFPPFVLGVAALVWAIVVALDPTQSSIVQPIGSAVLLFQTVFAILSYGFLAERIRQLAPTGGRRGGRLLATQVDPINGRYRGLMIRNARAVPLSERPRPLPRGR